MSKLTDYGIMLLTYAAKSDAEVVHTARELAEASDLPLPTVSKILKALSKAGVLVSHRGTRGGYTLARPAADISVVDVIQAIDGLPALTQCSEESPTHCDLEGTCPVRSNWRLINNTVVQALSNLTLAQMTAPLPTARATLRRAGRRARPLLVLESHAS